MRKEQAHNTTITLHLSYSELQLLLSILRADVRRRDEAGTVSEWHDDARSLFAKTEAEARSPQPDE